MAEDNLYWASVYFRWMIEENFRKGPVNFFKGVPAPVRPVVVSMVRRRLRKTLHGQGIGRHSPDEITAIGKRSVDAMADYLGDKPFFMGTEPAGIDATMFAFALCPICRVRFPNCNRRRPATPISAAMSAEWPRGSIRNAPYPGLPGCGLNSNCPPPEGLGAVTRSGDLWGLRSRAVAAEQQWRVFGGRPGGQPIDAPRELGANRSA